MGRKRTGQIIELVPGKFRIKIQRGTGSDRKSFTETFDGTLEQAQEFLEKCLNKLSEFERIPEKAKTVGILAHEYLDRAAILNISERTLLDYKNLLRRYIMPNIGERLISEIRAVDVRDFYSNLRHGEYTLCYLDKGVPKTKKATTKLSPAVVHKVHMILKPAFKYALEKEWLDNNIMLFVSTPTRTSKDDRLIPSTTEIEMIFEKCRSIDERALWMTAYFTGSRPEEYLALRWSDVSFDKNFISIKRVSVEMPGSTGSPSSAPKLKRKPKL